MGGFKAFGFQPNTRVAVFVFGLFHGFGLATKLQEYSLSRNGLVTNILSFNGGVEIGQFLAEYNWDPLGTGRLLGLTEIASPTVEAVASSNPSDAGLTPTQSGTLGQYPSEFKLDVFEITLQPYEYVEYKYHLEQHATMLYSWTASAPLIHDFHGERTSAGEGEEGSSGEQSYDKQNRRQANGSFAAPFVGIHGWYWENPGRDPITIRLTSSGFYSAALEIRSDRTRSNRDLRPLATLSPSPEGTTR